LLNRKINQLTEIIQNSEKQKEIDRFAVEKRGSIKLETAVAVVATELLTKQQKSVEEIAPAVSDVQETIVENKNIPELSDDNEGNLISEATKTKIEDNIIEQPEIKDFEENSSDLNDLKENEQLLEINVLRKKLQETESAMAKIIARMGNAPASLNSQVRNGFLHNLFFFFNLSLCKLFFVLLSLFVNCFM